ncbi:MAG: hypothetical protein Q8L81_08100 [Bacteroidota bacterium]|nr:hypothetical protein [Bacteroidota bacterium]
METTENVRRIPRRIVLVSAIMLVTISTTASTLSIASNPMKENMFVFYLTAVFFFALFLLYVLVSRLPKNNQGLEEDLKAIQVRRKHHHYRKVIRKTS